MTKINISLECVRFLFLLVNGVLPNQSYQNAFNSKSAGGAKFNASSLGTKYMAQQPQTQLVQYPNGQEFRSNQQFNPNSQYGGYPYNNPYQYNQQLLQYIPQNQMFPPPITYISQDQQLLEQFKSNIGAIINTYEDNSQVSFPNYLGLQQTFSVTKFCDIPTKCPLSGDTVLECVKKGNFSTWLDSVSFKKENPHPTQVGLHKSWIAELTIQSNNLILQYVTGIYETFNRFFEGSKKHVEEIIKIGNRLGAVNFNPNAQKLISDGIAKFEKIQTYKDLENLNGKYNYTQDIQQHQDKLTWSATSSVGEFSRHSSTSRFLIWLETLLLLIFEGAYRLFADPENQDWGDSDIAQYCKKPEVLNSMKAFGFIIQDMKPIENLNMMFTRIMGEFYPLISNDKKNYQSYDEVENALLAKIAHPNFKSPELDICQVMVTEMKGFLSNMYAINCCKPFSPLKNENIAISKISDVYFVLGVNFTTLVNPAEIQHQIKERDKLSSQLDQLLQETIMFLSNVQDIKAKQQAIQFYLNRRDALQQSLHNKITEFPKILNFFTQYANEIELFNLPKEQAQKTASSLQNKFLTTFTKINLLDRSTGLGPFDVFGMYGVQCTIIPLETHPKSIPEMFNIAFELKFEGKKIIIPKKAFENYKSNNLGDQNLFKDFDELSKAVEAQMQKSSQDSQFQRMENEMYEKALPNAMYISHKEFLNINSANPGLANEITALNGSFDNGNGIKITREIYKKYINTFTDLEINPKSLTLESVDQPVYNAQMQQQQYNWGNQLNQAKLNILDNQAANQNAKMKLNFN